MKTILAIIILIGCGFICSSNKNTPETTAPEQKEQLNYEIISNNNGIVLFVVTKETSDEKIIKLNNRLKDKYRKVNLIHYFDDAGTATNYFDKITSSDYTEKQKDKMFRHYIMQYKNNNLYRNVSGNWNIIKVY